MLTVRNNGSDVSAFTVNFQLPPGIGLVSNPPADLSNGNVYTWNFAQLLSFEERVIQLIYSIPPPPAFMPDDMVNISGNVSVQPGESNIVNNSFNYDLSILSSYDPNDKTMLNGKSLTPAEVNAGNPFTYQIRFQNTGNYPASFIHVRDTLETGFDYSSFKTVSASHDYSVTIDQGRYIDWYFPNIMLPDSTSDEPGSHGYVLFSVNPLLPLSDGDQLENTAHIYFDFNPAVITNTEITSIAEPLNISEISSGAVSVVNSVVSGTIYLTGHVQELQTVNLISISGELIKSWNSNNSTLSVDEISDGVYFLECFSENARSVSKLFIRK
jgi:uncharacterized repeat protein (TIGR01451 family)